MCGVDAADGGGAGNPADPSGYPAHREADIVLSDGGTALLRPIRPEDGKLLVDFYAKVSEESKYFRFFAPYPILSARDVEHFTTVDQHSRVAVIVTVGDEMIAVGRYDQTEPGEAEVAFLVQDAHQNRGLASVLLEHLAQTARENGIGRFVAEVLPHNQRMMVVFRAAGYTITDSLDDGVVSLEFQIAPTGSSIDVMSAREHRAEARSVQRLLCPRSVAVVGASRFADKVGQTLLRNIVMGNFAGTVYPINPAAEAVAGLPAYPDVASVPGEIDLAVIAVPIDAVAGVVRECAAKGVKGLVVVSTTITTEADGSVAGEGVESQRELVAIARRHGMRMIGPHAFGAINTDPALRLNASLADIAPARSHVGVFSQSGALGPVLLASLAEHDLGVSSFVAAGYRGDVSANDMLQYFGEDDATDVVLLYLESVGNPRKFSRIARRLSLTRPVVAVRSGRTSGLSRPHELSDPSTVRVPPAAADAMFTQAGIVLVDSVTELANTAALLAFQPLPTGDRIAIVGNSEALQLLAADEIERSGLRLHRAHTAMRPVRNAQGLQEGVLAALDDDEADAVLVVLAPSIEGDTIAAAQSLTWAAASASKPVAAVFAGVEQLPLVMRRLDPAGTPGRGTVPAYASPEAAVGALAKAVAYRQWRDQPMGEVSDLPHIDTRRAHTIVDDALAAAPESAGPVLTLRQDQARDLLAAYGIPVWPSLPAATADAAVAHWRELDGEVVLKVTNPQMRQRLDMADVRPNLGSEEAVRGAWRALTTDLGPPEDLGFVVQRMAPRGVPLVMQIVQDDTYGPVVSFGLAGLATDLLGDTVFRIPPITAAEADRMIRQIRAAPMLFGHEGGERVDLTAVTDLIERLSRLADDLPEAVFVELGPVLAGSSGLAVLACRAELVRATDGSRQDAFTRRLSRL
jgi:acyl-CoA synthetase (NDP forming)/RimJ/RimL family protein N-acetyltransferase